MESMIDSGNLRTRDLAADAVEKSALPFRVEFADQGYLFAVLREAETGYVVQRSCLSRSIVSITDIISLLRKSFIRTSGKELQ